MEQQTSNIKKFYEFLLNKFNKTVSYFILN